MTTIDIEASVEEVLAYNRGYYTDAYVRRMVVDAGPCPQHPSRPEHWCVTCWETETQAREEKRVADERAKQHAELDRRLPVRYRCAITDNTEIIGWCDRFLADIHTAGNLILGGPTSSGKTHAVAGLVRRVIPASVRIYSDASGHRDVTYRDWAWWNWAALATAMRPGGDMDARKVMRDCIYVDLLVLDDLGTSRITEWAEEWIYELINSRYEVMRPVVITTNLAGKPGSKADGKPVPTMREVLGERIMSRLTENRTSVVLKGTDYRANPVEKPRICPAHGVDHAVTPVGRHTAAQTAERPRGFWEN